MPICCVDTSAFIDLNRRFPRDIFETIWTNIEAMSQGGDLIAPEEVFNELQVKDDVIFKWAKDNRRSFLKLDSSQSEVVKDVLMRFPGFVDANRAIPIADPFVIALAITTTTCVVTEERFAKPNAKPRIPDACQHYKIQHYNLFDFFRAQGWKF